MVRWCPLHLWMSLRWLCFGMFSNRIMTHFSKALLSIHFGYWRRNHEAAFVSSSCYHTFHWSATLVRFLFDTHIACFYACAQYIQYFLEAITVVSIFFLVFVESKARWPPFHYSMILANSSHPDISCSQWLEQQSMTWNFSLLQEPLPALLREQLPVKGQLLYNAAMHKPSLDLPQRKKWKRRH